MLEEGSTTVFLEVGRMLCPNKPRAIGAEHPPLAPCAPVPRVPGATDVRTVHQQDYNWVTTSGNHSEFSSRLLPVL